jgi:predicted nucleic acid-binding protein
MFNGILIILFIILGFACGNNIILIPAIALVEIIYLMEKKRIPMDAVQKSLELLLNGADNYRIVPLDGMVVQSVQRVDRATVPDLPDRVIAATALSLNLPLITRDANIGKATELNIVW